MNKLKKVEINFFLKNIENNYNYFFSLNLNFHAKLDHSKKIIGQNFWRQCGGGVSKPYTKGRKAKLNIIMDPRKLLITQKYFDLRALSSIAN